MTRLDSFIRRLQSQRACLDRAVELIRDLPGPVLELGLGNGRSYDHLRSRLPGRAIFVFDRQVAAHPDCVPPARSMVLGDFLATLPQAAARIGAPAALIHADIGSGDKAASVRLAAALAAHAVRLLAEGGVLVSDQPMMAPGLAPLPLPAEVDPDRYHMYRRRAG